MKTELTPLDILRLKADIAAAIDWQDWALRSSAIGAEWGAAEAVRAKALADDLIKLYGERKADLANDLE